MFNVVMPAVAIGLAALIWLKRPGVYTRLAAALFLTLIAGLYLEAGLRSAPRRTGVPMTIAHESRVSIALAWNEIGGAMQYAVAERVWIVVVISLSLAALAATPARVSIRQHRRGAGEGVLASMDEKRGTE